MSERNSLWPQSVPGCQPPCERLPPASWAVVWLGVGMVALCCAVWSCVEFGCSDPSISCAAVFASRKYYGKIYRQHTQLSQYCRYWAFQLCMSSDFQGAIADTLHLTQPHRSTTTTIHVHTDAHFSAVPWNNDSILQNTATTRWTTAAAFRTFIPL